jgi:DNA-binding beta-propeller fold protein YncE
MYRRTGTMLMAAAAALALAAPASAAGLKQFSQIVMPGATLESFDITFADPETGQVFIADRSNKAIDVIDSKTDKYVTRITGFVGDGPKGDVSGPNGVATVNHGTEVWAGDGDSTVKVIDLKAGKIVDTIATGGKKRADEVAYDPKDEVFAVVNDADEPPFVTLISTKPGHKILAKLVYPEATDGIEQPQYNPMDGMFYIDLPEINKQQGKGGLIVINPRTAQKVKILPVDNCTPHGQSVARGSLVFLACNAGNVKDKKTGQMAVFDIKQGRVVATIPGAGGSDEGWANNNIGQYYAATANDSGGPALTVIDAKSNKIIQKYKTAVGAHSVAASLYNNHVYVPTRASNGGCGGCVLVLAPE